MLRLRNKFAAISISLSVICALNNATTAQTKSSSKTDRTSVNQENGNWNWHHNDSTVDLYVTIRGKVEFADGYSDITSITADGEIRVKDDRGGELRKFEATAEGGSIKRSYSVNGQSRAFDDDARRWLANILNQTVRLGGYDARARVQKLLKQSGPRGVLAEMRQEQAIAAGGISHAPPQTYPTGITSRLGGKNSSSGAIGRRIRPWRWA